MKNLVIQMKVAIHLANIEIDDEKEDANKILS